jgi:hypothetical protein
MIGPHTPDDDARLAWDRGSGRCWHCGRLLRRDQFHLVRPAGWIVEHHVDGSHGLRLVCWGCHELKGEHSDEEWKAILERNYPGRGPSWRNRRLIRRH